MRIFAKTQPDLKFRVREMQVFKYNQTRPTTNGTATKSSEHSSSTSWPQDGRFGFRWPPTRYLHRAEGAGDDAGGLDMLVEHSRVNEEVADVIVGVSTEGHSEVDDREQGVFAVLVQGAYSGKAYRAFVEEAPHDFPDEAATATLSR